MSERQPEGKEDWKKQGKMSSGKFWTMISNSLKARAESSFEGSIIISMQRFHIFLNETDIIPLDWKGLHFPVDYAEIYTKQPIW